MEEDILDIYSRVIMILAHELMMNTNMSENEAITCAFKKAVFDKYLEKR